MVKCLYRSARRQGRSAAVARYGVRVASPGARAYYDTRHARGASHHQALRALGNRLVGILHGCLQHHQRYNETTTWATPNQTAIPAAA